MDYILSNEVFHDNFFDKTGKLRHMPGKKFKLFPFVANTSATPVTELGDLAGGYLCKVEGKKPVPISLTDLTNELLKDMEGIQPGQEKNFEELICQMFFESDDRIRPINLTFLEQIECKTSTETRIAEYLVDVLGDRTIIQNDVQNAKNRLLAYSNVLEKVVMKKVKTSDAPSDDSTHYFTVVSSLKHLYEEDFLYVLDNPKRTREYLIPLLEFYFFSYTAQTAMQLNRFFDGDRETNIPLYFCLEWEKTNQSRKCFTEGWQMLQEAIKVMFAHAVTLEILNQTKDNSDLYDYIKISELVKNNPEMDVEVAAQVAKLTASYREAITDCPDMNEYEKKILSRGETATEIKYLFESIKIQFENTNRSRAYESYADKFEKYCHKYLKNRGRSGLILNISEETLIFLTKICIKDQEKVRLKDVFEGFEERGVYLDDSSKEQVTEYYEKLNLIEKKSDSGDAKYVKRIL